MAYGQSVLSVLPPLVPPLYPHPHHHSFEMLHHVAEECTAVVFGTN